MIPLQPNYQDGLRTIFNIGYTPRSLLYFSITWEANNRGYIDSNFQACFNFLRMGVGNEQRNK